MKYSKTQRFILFTIGAWFDEANKQVQDKPLQVSISKRNFIELATKSGIAKKQERALYKNLEVLEKKRLLSYENRGLKLTKKGGVLYKKIRADIEPFINVLYKLVSKSPTSYTKRVQTVFK